MSEGFKKRKTMSDIVPPRHRSRPGETAGEPLKSSVRPASRSTKDVFKPPPLPPHPKKQWHIPRIPFPRVSKKIAWWAIPVILLYGMGSVVFANMQVLLTPKARTVALDETLTLSRATAAGEVLFGDISLADQRKESFSSGEQKTVEAYARGTITIFNKNSQPQALVARTRFESPSGAIYRIDHQVTIPANGSLDTEVIADEAGEKANEKSGIDFVLPAFREQRSPRYETITARSKTALSGGASGVNFWVGEDDVAGAREKMVTVILADAREQLLRKLPEDSYLLGGSVRYSVSDARSTPVAGQIGKTFEMELIGSIKGAIINKKALERALAQKIPNYDGSYHFEIKNLDELSMELSGYSLDAKKFTVRVRGIAEFVSAVDTESAHAEIFERKLNKSAALLASFPGIERAEIRFRPFWLRSFPETPDRIIVKAQ